MEDLKMKVLNDGTNSVFVAKSTALEDTVTQPKDTLQCLYSPSFLPMCNDFWDVVRISCTIRMLFK